MQVFTTADSAQAGGFPKMPLRPQHMVAGYKMEAGTVYIKRHNKVG